MIYKITDFDTFYIKVPISMKKTELLQHLSAPNKAFKIENTILFDERTLWVSGTVFHIKKQNIK